MRVRHMHWALQKIATMGNGGKGVAIVRQPGHVLRIKLHSMLRSAEAEAYGRGGPRQGEMGRWQGEGWRVRTRGKRGG